MKNISRRGFIKSVATLPVVAAVGVSMFRQTPSEVANPVLQFSSINLRAGGINFVGEVRYRTDDYFATDADVGLELGDIVFYKGETLTVVYD